MPLLIYFLATIFVMTALGSTWGLWVTFEELTWYSSFWAILWIIFDLTIAIGLVLRWRLSYVLFMAQISLFIVVFTIAVVLVGISTIMGGLEVSDIWIVCGSTAVALGCSYVYRYFRRSNVRNLYFPTKT